jgi:hypothetical protein
VKGSVGVLDRNFIVLLFASYASGAVLHVGPGQQYATPCRAITAASAGDKIQIDASGSYGCVVCGWTTNDLTIVGVNGRPKIEPMGRNAGGKAIWVISGNNAAVPDHNGAAIRQEGANLTSRLSWKWREYSTVKITDRALEETTQKLTQRKRRSPF